MDYGKSNITASSPINDLSIVNLNGTLDGKYLGQLTAHDSTDFPL